MKWINKGNEVIENVFKGKKKIKFCLYGAGMFGGDLYITLKYFDMFKGFIDNDKLLQKRGYKGEKVISEKEYFYNNMKTPIIICASESNTKIIKDNLEKRGMEYNKDFFVYNEFIERIFPVLVYERYNKSFINITQICVTERCTLKCRKCAHGCYNVPMTKKDMTLEQVEKTADIFFSKVDYIHEFVLIGGEPLLYEYLPQVVEYIGNRYRSKINIFSITSNGTIIPPSELLEKCRKHSVLFRISNYTNSISKLEEQYERLKEIFKNNDIDYRIGKKETTWMDYGFDYYKRECSDEALIKVFDECHTPCHEVRENKFYYCVMARSVAENLKFNVGDEDYLDLRKLTESNWKREFLEFILGYSEKGYMDMCRYCHGASCHDYPIPVAEQMERI